MDHPQIEAMQKYGHKSFREMLDEAIEENRIIEDVYGEEINIGDDFVENEHGELIHEKSAFKYLCEIYDKKTR